MRIIFLISFIFLCSCTHDEHWDNQLMNKGEFSVLTPGMPETSEMDAPNNGIYTLHTKKYAFHFGEKENKRLYQILIENYNPIDSVKKKFNNKFNTNTFRYIYYTSQKEAFLEQYSAKLIEDKIIMLQNNPCKELIFIDGNLYKIILVNSYSRNYNFYVLIAEVPLNSTKYIEEAHKFLYSFRFNK